MSNAAIFLFEWKHFVRSPFKVVALVLFVLSGIYALHNGANLYREQIAEIHAVTDKAQEQRQETLGFYQQGKKGPKGRPWVDLGTPFWAIWSLPVYHFKHPAPAMVYGIGQAEQYGFYKRVTFRSSPYDMDMVEEIANPERLQSGTLSFPFVVLYLLPLLLLIWLYDIKGAEADAGFLPLVYVQTRAKTRWLLTRVGYYVALLLIVVLGLMLYGTFLAPVFAEEPTAFWRILALVVSYTLLWSAFYTLVIHRGNTTVGNTLVMVGLWLLLAFVVPAAVHQWVSTRYPPNLMTEIIDARREGQKKLFEQPDSVILAHLGDLYPEIVNSPVATSGDGADQAISYSAAALTNEMMKRSISEVEASNEQRNRLIRTSYWLNPVIFFQNEFNRLTRTHYRDYEAYRRQVQELIDQQARTLVVDTWHATVVDEQKYLDYSRQLIADD